jgi:hypothetical protein
MRFAILLSGYLGFVTTSLLNGAQFSQTRDLPPLKLAANELDMILSKTHSFLNAVNGPSGDGSTRESVKLDLRGHEIEIPHFSLASSVAFPDKIYWFSYAYSRDNKVVSSVAIDLSDSSRRVSVSGESADEVGKLSNLLENELRQYSTPIGGMKFRRVAGVCLSMLFLMSLMISSAYCWKTQNYSALGMPVCSALGFLLLVFLPWNRLLPGFVLFQRYSPFFLIRHMSEISVLALLATLAGIPLSYFLARHRRRAW